MSQTGRELSDSFPVIAGYTIGDVMGRGPLGTVYSAVRRATGEKAVMRGFAQPPNSDAGRWQAAKEQFRQLLAYHKRIADMEGAPQTLQKIIGFGEERGLFWVASEYFEARPLHQILLEEGPQSFQWTLAVLRQVGEAVDYAARYGLSHTDLTPSNVLVVRDPQQALTQIRVEVINFGLAHARKKYGSPYAAPEQMGGKFEGDSCSDVYGAGALLYELLTAKPIFSGTPDEIAHKARTLPPEPLQNAPAAVQNVLNRMLAKDPKDRYNRVLDAVNDLAMGRSPAEGLQTSPELAQLAPYLGKASRASDSEVREELQLENKPQVVRGTAFAGFSKLYDPAAPVQLQEFDVSGQDMVKIYRRW